jgi:citrate synthase
LIYGALPSKPQLKNFENKIMNHTYIHTDLERITKTFRYDSHPMGMLASEIAIMSTIHPEANPSLHGDKIYKDTKFVNKQIYRLLGNIPTLAAYCYRHRLGRPFNQPRQDLSYVENFLYMLDCLNDVNYKPNPVLTKVIYCN